MMDHVSRDFPVRDDISKQPSSAAEARADIFFNTVILCQPNVMIYLLREIQT